MTGETIVNNAGGPFAIHANDVTIDGFTIQGQSADNSGPGFGYAVLIGNPTTGYQILNDIFQNNHAGIGLSNTGVDQLLISQNLFQNNGDGLSTDIYYDQFVGGNQLSNVLIDNNKFTNTSYVEDHWAVGISNTSATPVTGLTISNNDVTNSGRGFYLFGTQNSSITNSTVTGADDHYAVGLFGYAGAAPIQNILISGNQLTNAVGGAGLLMDSGTSITVTGNTMTGNDVAHEVEGGSVKFQGNTLTGNNVGIHVENEAVVDAGGGIYGSTGGNILTGYTGTSGNYAIEDLNAAYGTGRLRRVQQFRALCQYFDH